MEKNVFDVDDIRKVREAAAERWSTMSSEEICQEINEAGDKVIAEFRKKQSKN